MPICRKKAAGIRAGKSTGSESALHGQPAHRAQSGKDHRKSTRRPVARGGVRTAPPHARVKRRRAGHLNRRFQDHSKGRDQTRFEGVRLTAWVCDITPVYRGCQEQTPIYCIPKQINSLVLARNGISTNAGFQAGKYDRRSECRRMRGRGQCRETVQWWISCAELVIGDW